ncbi:SprT-like domain-containing protein [Undibacterium sp.]|uniref:SprT-like domain-containing protein n=1 Tax=Undibacterium sp. TaxID=1914977 RepID=UPI0037510A40
MNPTEETYTELQLAYDFFNRKLFNSQLPDCLLTLQRKNAKIYGYFSPNRFKDAHSVLADELAMNPIHFHSRKVESVLSTLVHEQVHVWQQHFGKPGRGKYHNKEWANKMKSIGLQPSKTGKPGGKETGDQMTHYVIDGGLFQEYCNQLLRQGFILSWAEDVKVTASEPGVDLNGDDVSLVEKKDKSNRLKYSCKKCKINAWGKPDLKIICGNCRTEFVRS